MSVSLVHFVLIVTMLFGSVVPSGGHLSGDWLDSAQLSTEINAISAKSPSQGYWVLEYMKNNKN